LSYIRSGELDGINGGYKCRIRRNWFVVPSKWIPDAFMLRQVHSFPKLVVNEGGAMPTDTIHRVRFRRPCDHRQVAAAFLNSLTFAFSEIRGRSYGGGVLTFEPSEVEGLPLPLSGAERLPADEVDQLLRRGRVNDALDVSDRILLREGLGLSHRDVRKLREIWETLRDRRIRRRPRAGGSRGQSRGNVESVESDALVALS
jgi:adenine-specific DNA-methyltransferase